MRFHIEADSLTIDLEGGEVIWALKRELVIQRSQLVQAQWHNILTLTRQQIGLKIGTAIPGGLFAGRFFGIGGKNFLYVQHTQGLIGDITMQHVLELELSDHEFEHVYVTIDDPDMAAQIIAWWSGGN